ncbi:GspH/FimT family pseudopilin [Marinobacter sp. F4206]|uniref:GspH/FimT family pseudopilin n=1 Tax=Marinobacter sp. F4206 TaxID=2861777 RepID=UPI001C5CCC2E|nr:GspH/FimT family pseudopilin [Marinobacter sp. F4206]MBW4936398.1 GspH/FimT family pseudopilin [Marinobacter sp. F4206]
MAIYQRAQGGFTLLELLISTSILTIVISLTAPSIASVIGANQLESTSNLIQRTISLTRSESVKRGHRVVMCLSDQKNKCNPSRPIQLIVFADEDRTGIPSSSADLIKLVTLDHPTVLTSYNRPFLAFSPIGYAAGTNGTFKTCHRNGDGELIIVSTLGRTRKAVDYDGDGLVEKTPGNPISC